MNISEVKDLMNQFNGSTLREFSWKNADGELSFSKNEGQALVGPQSSAPIAPAFTAQQAAPVAESTEVPVANEIAVEAEGEAVTSPLVGVAYLKPSPDKAEFAKVGDTVKKGQTLLIIEAMKVMNEIPAPKDGIITEVMVSGEDVVEFGQDLMRIK